MASSHALCRVWHFGGGPSPIFEACLVGPFRARSHRMPCVAPGQALIKKRESEDLNGIRDVEDGSTETGEPSDTGMMAKHFVHHMFPTHGKGIGVTSDMTAFDRMKPSLFTHDRLKSLFEKVKFLPTLAQWLNGQLGGKDTASAALDKPKYIEQIHLAIGEALPTIAFEKPYSVLHEVLGNAFAMSIQVCTAKFSSHGFLPYGLGGWLLPFQGSALVIGVAASSLEGHSFGEKCDALMASAPDRVAKYVQQGGFAVLLDVGAAAWVPPGFLAVIVALGPSAFLRWSSMSSKPTQGCPELRAVLSSATQMVSSYPVLAGNYQPWLRFLEVSTKVT